MPTSKRSTTPLRAMTRWARRCPACQHRVPLFALRCSTCYAGRLVQASIIWAIALSIPIAILLAALASAR